LLFTIAHTLFSVGLKVVGVVQFETSSSAVKDHKLVRFRRNDHVRWVRALSYPEYENAVVIPNDASLDAFTMYDVEFQFGKFTLYGTQIEADAPGKRV
jgi:hypothetical protein